MLQPADLHGATATTMDDDSLAYLRPPRPCADVPPQAAYPSEAYPSAVLCRRARAVSAVVRVSGTSATAMEYVAVYRPNGARRYIRDLHRALDRCRGIDAHGSWTIIDTRIAGRESLLLRLRQQPHDGRSAFIAVARVGRVLVVVADVGSPTRDGHRRLVEELIGPAMRRASVLL